MRRRGRGPPRLGFVAAVAAGARAPFFAVTTGLIGGLVSTWRRLLELYIPTPLVVVASPSSPLACLPCLSIALALQEKTCGMAVQARFGGGLTGRRHATLSAKGLSPADLTINLRGAAPWPGQHCTQQPPAVVVAGDAMQLQLQLQLQIDAFAILPCFLSFFSFFTNTQKNCASLLY